MLSRALRSRALLATRLPLTKPTLSRRTLVNAPKLGDGPLMQRRPDRELPEIQNSGMKWAKTIPLFLAILISCTLAIFNYQKSNSSVVASTLYALRTSPAAREYLGDEIYFAHKMPWIWGEMNQLHGRINIEFEVKGSKNRATMKFKSTRATRQGMFTTSEWCLVTEDGRKIDLLDTKDPFEGMVLNADEMADGEKKQQVGRGSYSPSLSQ